MNNQNKYEKPIRLIVIGGGFGGLQIIKCLKNTPIEVLLFDKNNYHTFQPLLYQVATCGLGPDAIAYPLRIVLHNIKNISFRMAEVININREQNKITTSIGDFEFDYLLIATGSETNYFKNISLEKNCMQIKSVNHALNLRSEILQQLEQAVNDKLTKGTSNKLNFVVVGGGPTGVETAGALAEMRNNVLTLDYPEIDKTQMQIHLIEASDEILSMFSHSLSIAAVKSLEKLGVKVWLNTRVESYDGSVLIFSDGQSIESKTVIWSAGVKGKTLDGLAASQISKGNRIKVNAFNQVDGSENIFAIGDVALMTTDKKFINGHPMVAPVAVQQAQLFCKNIFSKIENKPLIAFRYYDKGSMATIGRHKAVFEAFGIKLKGAIAWFAWMTLHLMLLVGFRNRLVTFINWMWSYVNYPGSIRLIIRPFKKEE